MTNDSRKINLGEVYRIDLSMAWQIHCNSPAGYPRLEAWCHSDNRKQNASVSVTIVYKGNGELVMNTPVMGCRITVKNSILEELEKMNICINGSMSRYRTEMIHSEIQKFISLCEQWDEEHRKESKER